MADFLFEIGLDEIPARMIASAEAELGNRVLELLRRERILAADATLSTYSTPRRLAVLVHGIHMRQEDCEEQLTGPSWAIAFKQDQPTAAAEAFARKAGVAVNDLQKVMNAKGEYVGATVRRPGRSTSEILTATLAKEVLALYWAKNMYWRAGKPERFVRPIRWVVALLHSDDSPAIVPVEIAGITATNESRGHRILHGDAEVVIASPAAYAETLRAAHVVVDVAERRQIIRKALDRATRAVPGARWREDEPLVDTVVHLTEWPSALMGNFEPEYLALPEEVLVTVMRDHQKYFAVEGADGKLVPHFLAVLNIAVDEAGEASIRHGNQKVLRARFKDARFFWDVDQRVPLTDQVEMLRSVTFQKELGSYHWKTQENLKVVTLLADTLATRGKVFDKAALLQATLLAKTDLTAELVKEFTELQGIIGGLYARTQGLGETVAKAIYAQYTPASTDDAIPATIEGQILALADRIQTMVAMFSIGNAPTGSKDPFALRRAANGVIKISAEAGLPLTLDDLLAATGGANPGVSDFLVERLHFYLRDVKGFAYDVVHAVLAAGSSDVADAVARAKALTQVRGGEDFLAVSAAFKRMKNILRQAAEKQEPIADNFAPALIEAEEKALAAAAEILFVTVRDRAQLRDYAAALEAIATLRPAVDAFFDKVMVMAPDPTVRAARLALITFVVGGFSGIADFSEIVVG